MFPAKAGWATTNWLLVTTTRPLSSRPRIRTSSSPNPTPPVLLLGTMTCIATGGHLTTCSCWSTRRRKKMMCSIYSVRWPMKKPPFRSQPIAPKRIPPPSPTCATSSLPGSIWAAVWSTSNRTQMPPRPMTRRILFTPAFQKPTGPGV
ncbi:hypothetical protein SDC9_133143 [bioreactor metagenome]|uniref:Uncharacterized protein n=1 Tax=bioreactor metagenome TaxID=1076179 RepID=A0A645D938_9ZZZZ